MTLLYDLGARDACGCPDAARTLQQIGAGFPFGGPLHQAGDRRAGAREQVALEPGYDGRRGVAADRALVH